MDATTATTTSSAFLDWFQTSGQVMYIILQMLYWIAISFAGVFAAFQAKRFVDYKVGKAAAKASAKTGDSGTTESAEVAVDEFVD